MPNQLNEAVGRVLDPHLMHRADIDPTPKRCGHIRAGALPVAAGCLVAASYLWSPESIAARSATEVFAIASPSVVVVVSGAGKKRSFGSGVVIQPGRVATNCHVVPEGASLEVRIGKKSSSSLQTRVVGADRKRDLCILEVFSDLDGVPPAKIGSVNQLKIGARVYAIGAPRGLELTISEGIVSSLREAGGSKIIQTTAPISPGSSGGGLFDDEGRLVGITTAFVQDGQNLNFALPADWIQPLSDRADAAATDRVLRMIESISLRKKRDWNGLLAAARVWVTELPSDASAWHDLGLANDNVGEHRRAIEAYRESLRLVPRDKQRTHHDAHIWFNLGIAYGKAGQIDKASQSFEEAIRLNPAYLSALLNAVGAVSHTLANPERGPEHIYQTALRRIKPTVLAEGWRGVGVLYEIGRQPKEAIDAYRRAIELNPQNEAAWTDLGNASLSAGDIEQALNAYEKALSLDKQSRFAWNGLGDVHRRKGETESAIAAYRNAIRLAPRDWNRHSWYGLGEIYRSRGDTDQAIKAYREAVRNSPHYTDAWYGLGLAYARKGDRLSFLEVHNLLSKDSPELAKKLLDAAKQP